jgi:hypothetical protein
MKNHSEQVSVLLGGFKNPLKPGTQAGFSATTLNASLNTISISGDVSLTGVTTPRQLTSVSIGFDGESNVGAYANLMINLALSQALGYSCFFKVVLPSEFVIDNSLVTLDGTGFFTNVSFNKIDTATRSVIVQACTSSYGSAPQ